MSTPYFSTIGRQMELNLICSSWVGTPFVPFSCVKGKGGGVDCARFVAAVMAESGAVKPYDFSKERYAIIGDGAANLAIVTRIVTGLGLVPVAGPVMCGDVLIFCDKSRNHLAVASDPTHLWHVFKGPGVIESRLYEAELVAPLHQIYRAMEVAS